MGSNTIQGERMEMVRGGHLTCTLLPMNVLHWEQSARKVQCLQLNQASGLRSDDTLPVIPREFVLQVSDSEEEISFYSERYFLGMEGAKYSFFNGRVQKEREPFLLCS